MKKRPLHIEDRPVPAGLIPDFLLKRTTKEMTRRKEAKALKKSHKVH